MLNLFIVDLRSKSENELCNILVVLALTTWILSWLQINDETTDFSFFYLEEDWHFWVLHSSWPFFLDTRKTQQRFGFLITLFISFDSSDKSFQNTPISCYYYYYYFNGMSSDTQAQCHRFLTNVHSLGCVSHRLCTYAVTYTGRRGRSTGLQHH